MMFEWLICRGSSSSNRQYLLRLTAAATVTVRHLSFGAALLLLAFTAYQAQAQTVSGQVVSDADQEPLPGVNVLVKGTTMGTVTDLDGNYQLNADGEDTLAFSFIGFVSQQVPVNNRSTVDISLSEDVETLSEVVVVGYGTQQKRDLTGAVSSLRGEDLTSVPSPSPMQAMQGKVAGVQITSSSGAPGAAPLVRIRGVGTLNDASPLFVVDGVLLRDASDINYLNDEDIESMEVLKDASATAIYGARGANGVVIITTKSGKSETPQIDVNLSYGLQTIPKRVDLLNGPQFAQVANEIFPDTYADPNNVSNTDWQDEVFRTSAPMLDAGLSFSGATENLDYYVGFSYFNQEGVIPTSDFERYTLRLNNGYRLTDNIKVGHNLTGARFKQANAAGVVNTVLRAWPTSVPFSEDNTFAEVMGSGNALAALEYNNNDDTRTQIVGNFYTEINFLKDFTFRSSYGVDVNFGENIGFTPVFEVAPQQRNLESNLSITERNSTRWFWENTLNYTKELDRHRFGVLVGYTMQEERSEFLTASTRNLIRGDEDLRFIDVGETDDQTTSGNGAHSSIISYLFRVNYAFDSRYLLTLTGRYDGSSVFAEDNQYGFFPSVGVGWNIIEEGFVSDDGLLSNLKLRGSWGILGNDRIGEETRFSLIATGLDALFGVNEALNAGATIGRSANAGLIWEETVQWDIGLEVGLLADKLTAEFDYYDRTTNDILVPLALPAHIGNGPFVEVTFNAAQVLNRGFEFNVNWRDNIGDFQYGLGVLGTSIYNEVLDIGSSTGVNSFISAGNLGNGQNVTRTEVGQPIGSFYGYKVQGVFQNQQQLDESAQLGTQQPGDLRFADLNGFDENGDLTGQPDGIIDDADRTFIGSAIPDFIYGFNANASYQGFSLSLDFQGQSGNEIYNGLQAVRPNLYNFPAKLQDRWRGEGTSTTVPRATAGGTNYRPSEYFLEDGSFLRLRTVTLGYALPTSWVEGVKLSNVNVYLRGTNLFTLSDYSGYSPEIGRGQGGDALSVGIDLGPYPITSVYTLGVNVTF